MEKVAKEARCMECMTAFGGGAVRMCLDVIHTDSTARHFRVWVWVRVKVWVRVRVRVMVRVRVRVVPELRVVPTT